MTSILIVDDNELNLKLIDHVLKLHGYDIHTASNAKEALVELAKFTPNLILMDLQLPEINGFELTKLIKNNSNYKNIPIVAVTALAMKGDEEKALAAGCDGYITKPIDIETIHLTVANFIRQFHK